MVERVARAIAQQWEEPEWDKIDPDKRERFRTDAIAAIEAMREPTEGMVGAANQAVDDGAGCAITTWHAMIDAALGETR